MNPEVPNDEDLEELPAEYEALISQVADDLEGRTAAGKRNVLQKYMDYLGRPKGLPTIRANFRHPEADDQQARERRRDWMRQHRETINDELRQGAEVRKVDEGIHTGAIEIPIKANIVTDRFAQNLLRDVTAPTSDTTMIGEYGTTSQSQYKFMAINAMGVGTNPGAAAVGDTQLGAGAASNDEDQFCWYHIDPAVTSSTDDGTFGDSITRDVDADLVLDSNEGVQYAARPTGSSVTYESGTRAPADAQAQLSHNDNSPNAGDFEFVYDFTWRFGSDGNHGDGNFGSDSDPDEWREVGLANALMTADAAASGEVTPGGSHPDEVHHLATRRVFSGSGFAKTSDVELSVQYTVRYSSG